MTTIELANVSKVYGDGPEALTVLNGVSVKFESARSVAIVGKSGIGKSTLLHILGGLDSPTSGEVLFNRTPVDFANESRLATWRGENIGFIFQFHHLLGDFTAEENVSMPLLIRGQSLDQAGEVSRQVLTQMGLGERLRHRPAMLSGGEQQRVAIARSVVHRPRVILADEPTGNLDPGSADVVLRLLLDWQRNSGGTLIVVTHSQDVAASLDCVFEMQAGGSLARIR